MADGVPVRHFIGVEMGYSESLRLIPPSNLACYISVRKERIGEGVRLQRPRR